MNLSNMNIPALSVYEKRYISILISWDTLHSFGEIEGIFSNRRITQSDVNSLFKSSVLSNNFHVSEILIKYTDTHLPGLVVCIRELPNRDKYSRVVKLLLSRIHSDMNDINKIISSL